MKTIKIVFCTILFIILIQYCRAQEIKLGDEFTSWENSFKLIGISSATNAHHYEYTKAITKPRYGHTIDKLIVSVVDNIVQTKILLLIPVYSDIDIPITVVEQVEKELDVKLTNVNGIYGCKLNGVVKISVSRNNDGITSYKDRIMIYVSTI